MGRKSKQATGSFCRFIKKPYLRGTGQEETKIVTDPSGLSAHVYPNPMHHTPTNTYIHTDTYINIHIYTYTHRYTHMRI